MAKTTPVLEVNGLMWWTRNKEINKRVKIAEAGLQDAHALREHVKETIVDPAKDIRRRNNFSDIIRTSLELGYDKK